jgi:hypothetical protein
MAQSDIARGAVAALAFGVAAVSAAKRGRRRRVLGLRIPSELNGRDFDVKRLARRIERIADRVERTSDNVRLASAQARRVSRRLS